MWPPSKQMKKVYQEGGREKSTMSNVADKLSKMRTEKLLTLE